MFFLREELARGEWEQTDRETMQADVQITEARLREEEA
jgi:hypothetical protein